MALVAWLWRESLRWSSSMNGITDGSLEFSKRTSWAVMMALMCSKLMTMARSRPRTVDGYERSGSRIRRSRAGRPVRRMMACLPASTTWACPLESSSSHGRTPKPFFRSAPPTVMPGPDIIVRVGSGSSSVPDFDRWWVGWWTLMPFGLAVWDLGIWPSLPLKSWEDFYGGMFCFYFFTHKFLSWVLWLQWLFFISFTTNLRKFTVFTKLTLKNMIQ